MKSKNKKCIECGREDQPWFSKKRCRGCSIKSYTPIKKISDKQIERKKERSKRLSPFFEYHVSEIEKNPVCANCGDIITNPYYWSVCHILNKGKYKEVAEENNNVIYMCVDCHTKFDNIQNSKEVYNMKVFPKIYEKFLLFKNKVSTFGKSRTILEDYEKY